MTQGNSQAAGALRKAVIRNVGDLVEREMRRMDSMDDDGVLTFLVHSIGNILRRKDTYDSRILMYGLDLIKQRLTENREAHPDLLPVAVVMAKVPAGHLHDAAYISAKLKDVLDAHIANSQPNEWKVFVP